MPIMISAIRRSQEVSTRGGWPDAHGRCHHRIHEHVTCLLCLILWPENRKRQVQNRDACRRSAAF